MCNVETSKEVVMFKAINSAALFIRSSSDTIQDSGEGDKSSIDGSFELSGNGSCYFRYQNRTKVMFKAINSAALFIRSSSDTIQDSGEGDKSSIDGSFELSGNATKAEYVEGGGVEGGGVEGGGVVGGGVVGEGIVSQLAASGLGRERHAHSCLKVPRELLRSFPHSKRVGSYLVGKMINKGSFAKVMEGLHISTGEKVAIKVIDKKKARQDSYVLKNMKREPRIHQMVRHPHIVILLETLETENSYYMAMELCAGGDLMDRICEKKRLEEREVRRYTRQILSAVEHLHTHGIIH
ncbi:uncharacterized protein ACWYII_034543, partial [Salvelinus alpinus]